LARGRTRLPALIFASATVIRRLYSKTVRAWTLLGLVLFACASSPKSDEALRKACEADVDHDRRCLELLTTSSDGYEAREAVLAMEQQRKADDEQARLDRMRRDEDARQRARGTATSTPASTVEEDFGKELLAQPDDEREAGLSTGSSVRALKAERKTEVASAPAAGTPTPESYLRASECLVSKDLAEMQALMKKESATRNKERVGAIGIALTAASGLKQEIQAEIRHRGLAENGGETCSAERLKEVVDLLRTLVGPVVKGPKDAEVYERGLARLRTELETRAGLPRSM
jgi:hypothetical protein